MLVSTVSLAMDAVGGEFIWGVCGHPAGSYRAVPIETQIALLKELGATWYRIDVGTDLDWLDRIAAATAKEGYACCPSFSHRCGWGTRSGLFTEAASFPARK